MSEDEAMISDTKKFGAKLGGMKNDDPVINGSIDTKFGIGPGVGIN
jgi:hypothetical protein